MPIPEVDPLDQAAFDKDIDHLFDVLFGKVESGEMSADDVIDRFVPQMVKDRCEQEKPSTKS